MENERTVQLSNASIIGPLELRLIQEEDRRRIHHCDVRSWRKQVLVNRGEQNSQPGFTVQLEKVSQVQRPARMKFENTLMLKSETKGCECHVQ